MVDIHKVIVSGIELTTANERQILNMGGPYIGDLSAGNDLISKDCIINNFVYNGYMDLLFFVKYSLSTERKWIFSKTYSYFTINFYSFNTKKVWESKKSFKIIHLGTFRSQYELEIYPAFHDAFKDKQLIFNLNEEAFRPIDN